MAKVYVAVRKSGDQSFIDAICECREVAEEYVVQIIASKDKVECDTKLIVREIEVLTAVPRANLHYHVILDHSGVLEEQFSRLAWSHTPAYTKPSGGRCDRSFAYGLSRKGFDDAMRYAREALAKWAGGAK